MHPILADELAKATQRDRLAEAERFKLARQARRQHDDTRPGERRPAVARERRHVFAALRFLGS